MRKISVLAPVLTLSCFALFSAVTTDARAQADAKPSTAPAAGAKPGTKPGVKPPKPGTAAAAAPAAAPEPPPPPPGPPPLAESLTGPAKADYESAKLLFNDGDYAGASIKFKTAYDASKDARLLWNMAACEKALRHYAKVLKLARQYVAEGGDKLTDQDKKDADDLIKAIEPFTATLKLSVNEPGADVYIDDELVGQTPLEKPVMVDIGSRKVRVAKPGFKESSQSVPIGGAAEVPLEVKLAPEVHEGHVLVNAHAEDAIDIDGKIVGSGHYEGVVKSGGHTLRVTNQGMRPYQAEILVQDNETRRIDVNLEPEAKSGGGVPTWMWIAGGAVLAAGAGVGGYFIFKPKDETTSPVKGTVNTGGDPFGTVHASFPIR